MSDTRTAPKSARPAADAAGAATGPNVMQNDTAGPAEGAQAPVIRALSLGAGVQSSTMALMFSEGEQ